MGGAGFQYRREDGQDTDGFQPDGSGEIEVHNANCRAGRYTNGNQSDRHTAADLHSLANRHNKANLYPSSCFAQIHPATYGYTQADTHTHAGSDSNGNTDSNRSSSPVTELTSGLP